MDLEKEKEQLSHAVEVARLNAEILQRQDKENRRLWIANIVAWVIVALLFGCMAYQNVHMDATISAAISKSQETFNQAMIEALNSVAEMEATSEITTTTTMEGDGITYNDVAGNQFNDSAQQNGGAE